METTRISEAKKAYQELEQLAVELDKSYLKQYKNPDNPEYKRIADELQEKQWRLIADFDEKYQDLIDSGMFSNDWGN